MILRTLGTAGHVDHGKTALVEALTGTNTDRLAEERARGISIELGYALLDLGEDLTLSVVDVPGHERFVRTMVAGASGIDLALVCVACDDGVMPQTREHLEILSLLGVRHGVVALTKADLVDAEGVELARLDVAEVLEGHPLAAAPMVPVSVRSGAGLEELRAALAACARATPTRAAGGRMRMPIDRAFTLRGIGTVVTGTLWSGTLAVGDQVEILPARHEARVRSLEQHDRAVEEVAGGGRVAVALVGVERATVERGDMLLRGHAPPRSYRLDVRLTPLGAGVADGERVEVLHGTASTPARVVALGPPAADGVFDAQLRLTRPLATVRGDRFVVRRLTPLRAAAGGVVLDPQPPRHGGSETVRRRLDLLARGDAASVLAAVIDERPARVADLVKSGLSEPDEAEEAARALVASGHAVELEPGILLAVDTYRALADRVSAALAERAATHPLEPAVSPATVVPALQREALIGRLERDGLVERSGNGLVAPGARAASTAATELADALVAELARDPFAPPRLADALAAAGADERTGRALAETLEREGRIVRLPDGLALTTEAYAQARALVEAGCAANGSYTLADLRDATGSSRRYAQAILERLDIDGVTRRVGDARILRRRTTSNGPPGSGQGQTST